MDAITLSTSRTGQTLGHDTPAVWSGAVVRQLLATVLIAAVALLGLVRVCVHQHWTDDRTHVASPVGLDGQTRVTRTVRIDRAHE